MGFRSRLLDINQTFGAYRDTIFASGLLLTLIIFLVHHHSQTYVSQEMQGASIQLWLEPAHIFTPQEVEVAWNVTGINGIYLNEGGVIGNDQRMLVGDYCQPITFDIILEDDTTQTFTLKPVMWSNPLFIGASLGIVALLVIIALQFGFPLPAPISKLRDILKFHQPDYWQQYGMLWLRALLLGIIVYVGILYVVPTCLNTESPTQLRALSTTFTGVFTLLLLIASIFIPRRISDVAQLIRHSIPYPIPVALIALFWISIYNEIVFVLDVFRTPLLILLFLFGVALLFNLQNKRDFQISIPVPDAKRNHLLSAGFAFVIWLIVYHSPWVSLFDRNFLQTLLGFGLFVVPGALLTIIIIPQHINAVRLLTVGIVLSILITVIFASIVFVLGLSATVFEMMFSLMGFVLLYVVIFHKRVNTITIWRSRSFSLLEVMAIVCGIFAVFQLMVVMRNPELGPDILSYNPLVTEFAQTPHFSFHDVYLGTDNVMPPRLWLIGWPLAQSLIVNFANLNILQAFSELNALLVVPVCLALYGLIRRYNIPRPIALLVFIVFPYSIFTEIDPSHVGVEFLNRLIEDKVLVAWLMTPVFLHALYDYLSTSDRRQFLLIVLLAFTIVNSHATSFFYIALIAGSFTCLYVLLHTRKWHHVVIVAVIFGSCAIIPLGLRQLEPQHYVVDVEDADELGIHRLRRLAFDDDDRILGIPEELRDGQAFMIVYLAGAIAIFAVGKSPMGYYIWAGLVPLFIVSNPITAPLIGKLITVNHLWRATWFVPFAIATVFCLWMLFKILARLSSNLAYFITFLIALGLVLPIIDDIQIQTFNTTSLQRDELVDMTEHIIPETDDTSITVFADEDYVFIIPGLQWNMHTIVWRKSEQPSISVAEYDEREQDYEEFYSDDLTLADLNELLDTYDIDYFILSNDFEGQLTSLLEQSDNFELIHTALYTELWYVED